MSLFIRGPDEIKECQKILWHCPFKWKNKNYKAGKFYIVVQKTQPAALKSIKLVKSFVGDKNTLTFSIRASNSFEKLEKQAESCFAKNKEAI